MNNLFHSVFVAVVLMPVFAMPAMAGSGDIHVGDDGTISLRRKNLLHNASFEWNDYESRGIRSGQAAEWHMWGNGYGTYSDRSVPYLPNDATHGGRSQRIALNADGRTSLLFLQTVHGITPNLPYTFSADVKVDAPDQLDVQLNLAFYTNEKHRESKFSQGQSPTKFTRLSVSGTAPQGVNQIRATFIIRPKVDNARGTFWVDAAQLEQSSQPTPFCAGYVDGPAEYVGPAIDLAQRGQPIRFSWLASQPPGAELRFQLRSADSEPALGSAPWTGPANGDFFAARAPVGDNLVPDLKLDQLKNDHGPHDVSGIGYGDNDRKCTIVADDSDPAKKVLKVAMTRHSQGNGRWMVGSAASIQPDTTYAFTVMHKEDATHTPVELSVAFENAQGKIQWNSSPSEHCDASTSWKRDTLVFRTPKTAGPRVWLQVCLSDVGWIMSKNYTLHRIGGQEDWSVPAAHRGRRFIQYRALLSTTDSSVTPQLYRTQIHCGKVPPEIRWLNVLAEPGSSQKYCFQPGQTAVFKPQVIDYAGADDLESVELMLKDQSGRERLRAPMTRAESLADNEWAYAQKYAIPSDATPGQWQAIVTARSRTGAVGTQMVMIKVSPPYAAPPPRMLIGAIVTDYGFSRHKGDGLKKVIEKFRESVGVDIWKMSVSWNLLEPLPGQYNQEMIAGLKAFIAAAHAAGVKAQVGIQQQQFPDWVNHGQWDSRDRYRFEQTRRLCDTWTYLAASLKDCPGLDSYLLMNEENAVYDADVYLRSMMRVAGAVRAADPNPAHRITLRPNTRDPYLRTRIASDGSQDYDYGSGGYPTSASWYYKKYASPVSTASFLRMARFRESPVVFGGPGGIGEVGFFNRRPQDTFGDEEKLAGFQIAMRIAYELGADEYHLWSDGFSFEDVGTYYRKLAAYRDELVRKPRPAHYDLRLVIGPDEKLIVEKPANSSELDLSAQSYLAAVRYLDEKGYVWFSTSPEALPLQHADATITLNLSDLKNLTADQQEKLLAEKLRDVKPSGTPLKWPR